MAADKILKHRADVFSLLVTLAETDRFPLPETIRRDMIAFRDNFAADTGIWEETREQADIPEELSMNDLIVQLGQVFEIG